MGPVQAGYSMGKSFLLASSLCFRKALRFSSILMWAPLMTSLGRETGFRRGNLEHKPERSSGADTYRGVRRWQDGAEQPADLLPVGLQHGLEPLCHLHPLLLQLLVPTLQVPHSSLFPCQSEGERRGDSGLVRKHRGQEQGWKIKHLRF